MMRGMRCSAMCFCVQYSLRKGLSEQWGNNAVPLASSRSRFAALASKKTEFSGASLCQCIKIFSLKHSSI